MPRLMNRVLPLVGLGIVLALVGSLECIAAFVLFTAGMALGFLYAYPFLATLSLIPGAEDHQFFAGPILSLAVGLSLAIPGAIRLWVLPVIAVVAGAMVGVAVRWGDPGLHSPISEQTGIVFSLWIVAGACLTVRGFREKWFDTAGRILGSWLIAIGLLYGAASVVPKRIPAPPPQPLAPPPSNELKGPDPNIFMPDLDPKKRSPLPGGFDPSRQQ